MSKSPAPSPSRSKRKRWITGILTGLLTALILGILSVISCHRNEQPGNLMNDNEEFIIIGGLLRKTYTAFSVAQQRQQKEVTLILEPMEVKALLSRTLKQYYKKHSPEKAVLYADYHGDKFKVFVSQPLWQQLAVHLNTEVKIGWDGSQWQIKTDSPQLGWWALSNEMVENTIQSKLKQQIQSAPKTVRQILADSTIESMPDGTVQIVCRSPQLIMQLLQKMFFR